MHTANMTIVGNLTGDPKLFPGHDGKKAFCRFTVAVNTGTDNAVANFYDVSAFSDLAEGIATSLSKGQRVIVYGHLSTSQEPFTTEDGRQVSRTRIGLVATAAGPDLFFQYARVAKRASSNDASPAGEARPAAAETSPAPVPAVVGAPAADEEPF